MANINALPFGIAPVFEVERTFASNSPWVTATAGMSCQDAILPLASITHQHSIPSFTLSISNARSARQGMGTYSILTIHMFICCRTLQMIVFRGCY